MTKKTLTPLEIGDLVRFRSGDQIWRGYVYGFWEDGKPRIRWQGGLMEDYSDMDPSALVQRIGPKLLSRRIDPISDTNGTA